MVVVAAIGVDKNYDEDDDDDDNDDDDEKDGVDDSYILQVLLVGRVVVGAAIGVASAVVPVYISEVFVLNRCFYHIFQIYIHRTFPLLI